MTLSLVSNSIFQGLEHDKLVCPFTRQYAVSLVNVPFTRQFAIPLTSVPFCSLPCHFARFLCFYGLGTLLCSTEHAVLFSAYDKNKSKILIRRAI